MMFHSYAMVGILSQFEKTKMYLHPTAFGFEAEPQLVIYKRTPKGLNSSRRPFRLYGTLNKERNSSESKHEMVILLDNGRRIETTWSRKQPRPTDQAYWYITYRTGHNTYYEESDVECYISSTGEISSGRYRNTFWVDGTSERGNGNGEFYGSISEDAGALKLYDRGHDIYGRDANFEVEGPMNTKYTTK